MEQPLSPYSACNLGSINLFPFVNNPFINPEFNWDDFYIAVRLAVRALDEIVDENLNNHALPEQKQKSSDFRNIGLGIMGLADCLIAMKLKYGSDEAVEFCKTLMHRMFITAIDEDIELAKEKGAFPQYTDKVWNSTIINVHVPKEIIHKGMQYGLRNCSLLSIAPTGSLATMLNGISGGCEPYFALEYNRTTKSLDGGNDKTYKQYAPIVNKYKEIYPNKDLPDYFITSESINWKDRINMQAALQNACDTAISSTVNLPENTPKEDIEQLYLYAWKKGLKGITIFRSGCKRQAILSVKEQKVNDTTRCYDCIKPISRKEIGVTNGSTFCKKCACGTLYITVNKDNEGNIVEVFTHTSKGGICAANTNGLTRMVSLALRSGLSIDEIKDQLKGINCPACLKLKAKGDNIDGLSCPDILSKTILEFQNINNIKTSNINNKDKKIEINEDKCPECGSSIYHSNGCVSCSNCGWSRCN